MNEKELIQLLTQAKTSPLFGGDLSLNDRDRMWQTISTSLAFEQTSEKQPVYTLGDFMSYYTWRFRHSMMRPMAASLAAFVLVFGGWIGAVNASSDSLPGDVLYPVKLAAERLQLTFTASAQRRVKLHTQFAGRRLEEVTNISKSDLPDKTQRISVAVQDFKRELASASEALLDLKGSNPQEAVAVAASIDQKAQEFDHLLDESSTRSRVEPKEVEEAKQAVSVSDSQIVETLVTTHEDGGVPGGPEAIKQSFQYRYQSVKDRIALSLGRLAVLERVIEKNDTGAHARIKEARDGLVLHDDALVEAFNVMAAGGVRKAFAFIDEVSASVNVSQQIIAELELELTTPAPQEEFFLLPQIQFQSVTEEEPAVRPNE